MKVIGVTGMPGSGKSVISRVAESLGIEVIRMGDVIRDEASIRNEAPGKVAVDLRQEFGKFVIAERCVEKIKKISSESDDSNNPIVLIEGIRSPWEVEIFKKNFSDFMIIAVHSSPKTRFLRLKKRKRDDDSAEYSESIKRDQRELKFGIGEVIATSDYMMVNDGDKDILQKNVRSLIQNELLN